MKVVTLPVALIGLLVVGFLDRRQLVRSLIASLVVGVLFVSATLIWASWEVTWLSDMRSVQPPFWESLPEASTFLVESAAYWPAIALVPAALIAADRTERAVLAIALLLAAAPIVVQGQYYGYHAAALCVVAAVARVPHAERAKSHSGGLLVELGVRLARPVLAHSSGGTSLMGTLAPG